MLRDWVVDLGHSAHQGVDTTKRQLRVRLWFPGMDKAVKRRVSTCRPCQASAESKARHRASGFDNYCFWAILRSKNNKEFCRTETEQIFIILASYLSLLSNPTAVKESILVPICSFVVIVGQILRFKKI